MGKTKLCSATKIIFGAVVGFPWQSALWGTEERSINTAGTLILPHVHGSLFQIFRAFFTLLNLLKQDIYQISVLSLVTLRGNSVAPAVIPFRNQVWKYQTWKFQGQNIA